MSAAPQRACRICGCTQNRACPAGCWWVGPNLCSTCETARFNRGDPVAIADRTVRTIAEHFGVEAERVTPQALLTLDLGADSLDTVEIALALEEAPSIAIDDAQIDRLLEEHKTHQVQHIIDLANRLAGEQASASRHG